MAIDPSIALGYQSPQGGGMGNLAQTLGLVSNLKQFQANGAISKAYQQATDANGNVDQKKLLGLIAQDPNAAYNLPTIQGQILNQQNSQLEFDKNKLELATKQVNWLKNGMGSLLAKDAIMPADLVGLATDGIKQGFLNTEQATNELASAPTDPQQLRAWVQQHFLSAQDGDTQLKALMPTTQTINTGAQQVIAAINPLTGQPTGATSVFNNQLSPEAATAPTQIFDPTTGTMRSVTRQQFAQMAGGGGAMPASAAPGAGMGGSGALGTGRMTAPQQSGPGVAVGPALGAAEAAQVTAKGSAENSLSLQSQADNAPQAIYQLQNMREALKDFKPGPGADWQGQAKALALQVSPGLAERLGIYPQNVASQEEFKKFSTQLAQSLASNLGSGTDAKLASAVAANPNISLSKLGNQQIIDVLIATQRATAAKNQAWQNAGLPPEQYNRWSSQWSRDIDPRVFAAQDMDVNARYKMLDSLPKKEQEAFKRSWQKAHSAGLIE